MITDFILHMRFGYIYHNINSQKVAEKSGSRLRSAFRTTSTRYLERVGLQASAKIWSIRGLQHV